MRPAENIEKRIKKLRYDSNAETHKRVIDNVLQAMDKHEKQESGVAAPGVWRIIMKSSITKFAAAAAIIIAALIIVNQLGIPVEKSAFAQVAGRLRMARTLTYKVTTHSAIDMEMDMAFKEPGYMRITMSGGYISVMDSVQGKGLSIIPARKQFVEIEMSNLPDDVGRRQFDAIEKLRSLPDRADEELGEQEIDGRTVQGFRVREEGVTNTVWIDPKTRELVFVEMEFANAPGMSATMTGFRFDVDLDDALFSLSPPDGYSRVGLQVDTAEASEQDLIALLKLWSQWTKDGTLPPTLNPVELAKVSMEMAKAGKFRDDQTSEQERMQHTMQMTRAIMFLMKLPTESDWRYAGENVQFGDAETPIFWYKPAGSQTYRVIYGDLSVIDVAPEDLPE
jgi:outer membrane lipoprotein-sorting protein